MEGRAHVEEAAREHERFLWGLCYRMTGVAADVAAAEGGAANRGSTEPSRAMPSKLRLRSFIPTPFATAVDCL